MASTRALMDNGPVGLTLEEDTAGARSADCRRVQVRSDASIFEIHKPDDWIDLVARYPLRVPRSRRHDWWRATGLDASWAIPDYAAAAAEYDGIHLTVMGYLTTAGRALPVDRDHTVLAGWDPDQTWWLTAAARSIGPIVRWQAAEDSRDLTSWVKAPD